MLPEQLVPVLEHELNTKQLPLETWLRVKIRRTVTEDTIHVEAGITAGRTTFQESASLSAEALPFEFAESGRPDVSAISESEHVGLISGFRFEGAEGLYVGYESGRVVSNASTAIPLKHELTRVNRGTENEGVFVHSLRTLGEGQFRVVEKKTRKPLEIALVGFLVRHQCQDAALSQVFPYIHWTEKQDDVLTYVMEFIPGACDRRRSNIREVF